MSDISFTLVVFGVLFLLLLSISIYAQRPRFGGTSPKAIEVVVFRPFSNEIAYRTDITNRAACEKLLGTSARPGSRFLALNRPACSTFNTTMAGWIT